MKKHILSILFFICTVAALAVNLPTNSYNSYSGSNINTTPYVLGTGIKFVNQSVVGSYEGICTTEAEWNSSDADPCQSCCLNNVYLPCLSDSPDEKVTKKCYNAMDDCLNDCSLALNEYRNPLDAPVAFLFAMIAAYGAVAVYRRKMQQV